MPDILRVRYLGDTAAFISLVGHDVGPDCVFDVAGKVVAEEDDHWRVEAGNPPQEWALPKSIYAVETPPARKTKTATSSEE